MRSHLTLLCVLALSACDGYDQNLGPTPFLCGDDQPRCPMGYSCMMDGISGEEICVIENGSLSNDFDCVDDSALEPNGLLEEATATPIDTMTTHSVDGLAVCPAGDRDLFVMTVSAMNTNLELIVEFGSGATLQSAIVNAGGVPISVGAATADNPRTLRAFAQNLPVGTYYASVSAPVMETISVNNYQLSLTATPP